MFPVSCGQPLIPDEGPSLETSNFSLPFQQVKEPIKLYLLRSFQVYHINLPLEASLHQNHPASSIVQVSRII